MNADEVEVHETKGHVFADLGRPDPETHHLKAQIVAEIYRLTLERKLTQSRTGEALGISQPEVSRLFKGHFREYSVERLIGFLTAFEHDVEIVVRPHPRAGEAGRIAFKAVAA